MSSPIYTERQERANELCEQVAIAVSIISPPGLERWKFVWEFVDAPNAEFLLALSAWESDPTNEAACAIDRAYGALCNAWRLASAAFLSETLNDDQLEMRRESQREPDPDTVVWD